MKYRNNFSTGKSYIVDKDLNTLLNRLTAGMKVNGRIVDYLGKSRYLLRIWGYNIITESEHSFQQFDEIRLFVRSVKPHLVLDLLSADSCPSEGYCPQDSASGRDGMTHRLIVRKQGDKTDVLIF